MLTYPEQPYDRTFHPVHAYNPKKIKMLQRRHNYWMLILILLTLFTPTLTAHAEDLTINMQAIAPMRFDVVRFTAKPGQRVTLNLDNADQMMHNLVIVKPDTREKVVLAALQLGEKGQTMNFIPDSPDVLHKIPVLQPGKKKKITFNAPLTPGAYPYVCTYPGHGFIMYGVMYVQPDDKKLPPIEQDLNVPPHARTKQDNRATGHAYPMTRPMVHRGFMRDCSPAAIAVALPHNQNFVFDAGACYLRYIWKGPDFVDHSKHWAGNGNAFSEPVGQIYYRAKRGVPLRFGSVDRIPKKIQFLGYKLEKGIPVFRYMLDNVLVHEKITTSPDGKLILRNFKLEGHTTDVYFVFDKYAGAAFSNAVKDSSGTDSILFSPPEAKKFTIIMTEVPNQAPIAYYSMDDVTLALKPYPVPGAVGRANKFDGKTNHINTGIKASQLNDGGTLSAWVKLNNKKSKTDYAIFSDNSTLMVMLTSDGDTLENVGFITGDEGVGDFVKDQQWLLITCVITRDKLILYVDGKKAIDEKRSSKSFSDQSIYIGSNGKDSFFKGQLDEVRIYKRALSAEEIKAIYQSELNQGREVKDYK